LLGKVGIRRPAGWAMRRTGCLTQGVDQADSKLTPPGQTVGGPVAEPGYCSAGARCRACAAARRRVEPLAVPCPAGVPIPPGGSARSLLAQLGDYLGDDRDGQRWTVADSGGSSWQLSGNRAAGQRPGWIAWRSSGRDCGSRSTTGHAAVLPKKVSTSVRPDARAIVVEMIVA
jgi:hypothetical protein